MSQLTAERSPLPGLDPAKFQDPDRTADGEARAFVDLDGLGTLWFNTGTLCNIECVNCYIESSPRNERLVYLSRAEVRSFLEEISRSGLPTREIGFTGGEPFMNPHILGMLEDALEAGHRTLVLTNAMQPMQRPRVREGLLELCRSFGPLLTLRVSLDHYTSALHDEERGAGSWQTAMEGLGWLVRHGLSIDVAGRTCWGESQASMRAGYGRLFREHEMPIDAADPAHLVLFPEMDERVDVPEITTGCWEILDQDPGAMMCAWSRMVVKRQGQESPVVLPCTLLPYGAQFELGATLAEAATRVKLNHPHCAKFCVLGGGSCSAA